MAIRISRRSNTYDARNNRLTSRYLFLPHSDFGFCITDLGSRFKPILSHPFLQANHSLVDNPLYHSKHWYTPGSTALQETLNCISKFAGNLLLWFGNGSNSNVIDKLPGSFRGSYRGSCESSVQGNRVLCTRHDLPGFFCNSRSKLREITEFLNKFSKFAIQQLLGEGKNLQPIPALSLAGALVPPLDYLSRNFLTIPLENGHALTEKYVNPSPYEVEHRRCGDLSYRTFNGSQHAVEPRTGIEFPTILDNIFGECNSSLVSEVLVGTGSRTMKIIKIKSLKLYAFGFYVHPYDLCEKLGSRYASIPESEVNKHHNFYADLLREDIGMTVRLVVSCNGIKISTVRDAFEKSLRARLVKANPDTYYDCLRTFGSLFSEDIPIRVGTTIDFRRTSDGHLVTEIEGNQIGAVRSRDLCRAFFDMYIGDGPVSEQAKTEKSGKTL